MDEKELISLRAFVAGVKRPSLPKKIPNMKISFWLPEGEIKLSHNQVLDLAWAHYKRLEMWDGIIKKLGTKDSIRAQLKVIADNYKNDILKRPDYVQRFAKSEYKFQQQENKTIK